MQPWPSPRPGGASRKRLRGEPKRNAVFALLQRETASVVLGGRRLRRAGGLAPKRYRRQPGEKLTAGRRKTVCEGSFPDGRDAARPGAPVAQKERGTGA